MHGGSPALSSHASEIRIAIRLHIHLLSINQNVRFPSDGMNPYSRNRDYFIGRQAGVRTTMHGGRSLVPRLWVVGCRWNGVVLCDILGPMAHSLDDVLDSL
jgi:hypothetical protein